MVRRRHAQLTLSQVVLFGMVLPRPESLMEPWVRRVDEALDDEDLVDEMIETLRRRWPSSSTRGRHGTPAEVVLRMLVLKHLRDWSYEDLEREVNGSLVWRRFCRIDAAKVPDAKTMVRLGQLLEGPALRTLLGRVVQLAKDEGVTKGTKLRVDTTVVEANIHHPTDSGLCEDAVRVLSRLLRRLVAVGVKLPFHLRRMRLQVSRRMREIAQAVRLRGERAREAIKRPYRGLLRVARRILRQAKRSTRAGRRQMKKLDRRSRRKAAHLVDRIEVFVPLVAQVIRQTKARVLGGRTRSAGKILSLFEPWAEIIRKGKVHRPTEFGAVVKVQESDGGIVTDVLIDQRKADAPLLVSSVERHIELFGRAPAIAATDRGFYSTEGEQRLRELGVRNPVIPKPGHRSQQRILYEKRRSFRRGRAWRSGGEARISRLKHTFGMSRSRYRGRPGVDRSIHWAAIANNLVALGRFAARRNPSP